MVKRSSHSRTMEFVQKLRPIDNAFFPVLGQDPGVMEEILRVILNDDTLTVEKVILSTRFPTFPAGASDWIPSVRQVTGIGSTSKSRRRMTMIISEGVAITLPE